MTPGASPGHSPAPSSPAEEGAFRARREIVVNPFAVAPL